MQNLGIYSFSSEEFDKYRSYQKRVFNHLNFDITQLVMSKEPYWVHSPHIKDIVSQTVHDFYIFFDVDCIPLSRECITTLYDQIVDGNTLAGTTQTANHLADKQNSYVGLGMIGFSRRLFESIGMPDGRSDANHDEGQIYTELCVKHNFNVNYWMPSHVIEPQWDIYKNRVYSGKFGIGTTYEKLVYHNFCSRLGKYDQYFFDECEKVLSL